MDDEDTILSDGGIAVRDGTIAAIGPSATIREEWRSKERIDAAGSVAAPGLVDTHMHVGQTMMRGALQTLARTKQLRVPFWREYYVPFEAMLSPEDMYLSGQLAFSSMLLSGTTTFFEAGGVHPDHMAQAAVDTGIRGQVSRNTMDVGSRIPESMRTSTDVAVKENIELVERWPRGSRVSAAMSLRQIITSTPELVVQIVGAAAEREVKVHTHLVEGTYEIDWCLEQHGKRPVDYLVDLGVFTPTLHAAHSVLADAEDVARYARHQVSACHCAFGNYSIGHAPALHMWRAGVPIGLGTDGVNSHGTLDLFRVALATRIGQQAVYGTPVHNRMAVGAQEPLRMATRGGARAMGLDREIGSLEVGKRADIILLGTDGPDAAGYASDDAFFFQGASGRDVHTVVVDGAVVVKDREILTVDVAEVRAKAKERQRVLVQRLEA
ncbi:amidohydrolase family protein [Sphaerisporangium sp. NPDC088356]|uniref:amidohydrolase family protein n=1 Tax=Sphaerisporangium sp. NPDC088356 TaxID=3154871 RepID=UPI0034328964